MKTQIHLKEETDMNKKEIYDQLSRVLTEYEHGICDEKNLYEMLCQIQNQWEDVITVQE